MITRAVQSLTLSRFLLALAALSCTWTMSCLLSPVSCLLSPGQQLTHRNYATKAWCKLPWINVFEKLQNISTFI